VPLDQACEAVNHDLFIITLFAQPAPRYTVVVLGTCERFLKALVQDFELRAFCFGKRPFNLVAIILERVHGVGLGASQKEQSGVKLLPRQASSCEVTPHG
jgi:hypothetical protein